MTSVRISTIPQKITDVGKNILLYGYENVSVPLNFFKVEFFHIALKNSWKITRDMNKDYIDQ